MLGTGTPNPTPERMGPAIAIVVDEQSYLIDAGVGIVRRAEEAHQMGFPALEASNLTRCFLTHLHSDHTIGLPDLITTPWVLERTEPLEIYGPKGTKNMIDHLMAAYSLDREARMHGLEKANKTGIQVETTEYEEGLIYEDSLIQVEAFRVEHEPFAAFGFRFKTPDKVIVISGDTNYNENLIEYAKGCDILIHEVISASGVERRDPVWKKYHKTVHTTSKELGKIAELTNPKKIVFTHQLFMTLPDQAGYVPTEAENEQEMIQDVKAKYSGEVISPKDLTVID
jgi:ribonuclease BN (tRNA processing enzyme)